MNFNKIIFILLSISFLYSCADYKIKTDREEERNYYISNGFALIYDNNLFEQKIVNKKINNENIVVIHNMLSKNTPIKTAGNPAITISMAFLKT